MFRDLCAFVYPVQPIGSRYDPDHVSLTFCLELDDVGNALKEQ